MKNLEKSINEKEFDEICSVCGKEFDIDDLVTNGLGELECDFCYYESIKEILGEDRHPDSTISPAVNNRLPY